MTSSHPNRRRRRAAAVAGALSAALLLAACSPQAAQTGTDHPKYTLTAQTAAPKGDIDSFTWAIYAEPYSLDYTHAFDYPDNQVLANVCESLLRLNPDWTLSPGLAKSFSHPTPTTWVYELRDGVTFHDGTPMTAADAVASMRRHLDPAVGSSWYSVYQYVTSIDQTGPMEVTVTESRPDSQFNLAMGGSAGVVESAATLKAKGADYGNSTGGVNCTGPFEFTSWKSGESITLTRYANYWDSTLRAKAGKVTFLFMNDSTARTNALKSGQVDGSWMIPMDAADQLKSTSANSGGLYFGLNTAVNSLIVGNLKGPLGDVNVRKALLMALDRQGIVDAAVKGYGTVTNALTTKSVWGGASKDALAKAFDGLQKYPYDVKAAKALVEKAGRDRQADRHQDRADRHRLQRRRPGDGGRRRVDRPQGEDRHGHAERVHDPLHRSDRARGRRPLVHVVVPVLAGSAGDVLRAAHRRLQQLRQLVRPVVRRGRERRGRDRRPRCAFGEVGRGAAHRQRPAARGCRCSRRRRRSTSESASPACSRPSHSSTTRGRRPLALGEAGAAGRRAIGRVPTGRRFGAQRRGGGSMTVARRVLGKLGSLLLTLFLASLLVFFSRFLVPGDPIDFLLRGRHPSPQAIADLTKQYGLDLPPWQQYINWVAGILHGDFGRSLQYRQDVSVVIGERLPVTFGLVLIAGLIITIVGLAAGIVAALYKGRMLDRAILVGLTVLAAIPSFVGSIVLISVFAVQLGWFPSFGSGDGFFDTIYHLILPSIALAIVFIVLIGKVTRTSMVDQLGREHVEVATSRGLTRATVIRRHVLRNAIGPILTVSGVLVAGLLVASTIVESAFGLAGIGSLLVQSVDRLDFPVVQAIVLLVVTAFVVVNAIVDILEPVVDPRSAAGAGAR